MEVVDTGTSRHISSWVLEAFLFCFILLLEGFRTGALRMDTAWNESWYVGEEKQSS